MGNGNSRGAKKHKNGGRRGFPSGTFPANRRRGGKPEMMATRAFPDARRNHHGRGAW